MIYVNVDDTGRIIESFNDETVKELPEGSVELDSSKWNDRFDLRLVDGQWINDPYSVQEGETS